MVDIDLSTDFGARVSDHLSNDQVVWLTTVGANGTPQPSPVWFLWDGERVLIYSQPNTPKLRNIARSPRVSLNFNSTPTGGDVVILTGDAEIDRDAPPANVVPDYVEKYAEGMRGLSMTPDQFAQEYSVPIRVRPTRLRGF
ncbi:MAG: TIGR03667 family PPOX class F420-dependent oxidoreductase [Thermomicrobiales bacterium]|nr:TIGR03667 family PPOX class F420-dependent oxidoreductase [Thermomicrobiales bacterium]